VTKTGEELAIEPHEAKHQITQLTLGGVHELTPGGSYQTGIGAAFTFNWTPGTLEPLYGKSPTGFWAFLRIRPAAMQHGGGH
jgi:hypothetical protein